MTSGFLPLLVYLIKMKRSKFDRSIVNFLPFIVLIFFATFVETIVRNFIFRYDALKWFRLYDFLEFYTILLFYYLELRKNKLYIFFSICYLLLFIYLSLSWNNESVADQPLILSTIILVIISTVLWFVNVFKNFEETPLYKRSGFYIISILLIYTLGTSLSFLSVDFVYKNDFNNLVILNTIVRSFNIIARFLIVIIIFKSFGSKGNINTSNN